MTSDVIEKFIESGKRKNRQVNIHFKTRKTITGVFIESGDYQELKSKNFWRIVSGSRLEDWQKSQDLSLCRLFNGAEFTRLTDEQ
jgi:hypothetical protein